jgi:perosamine synthetase
MSAAAIPALLGGVPVRPEGPPAWAPGDADVWEALRQAYESGDWAKYHGGGVPRLEATLREYFHVEHVLLCGSGTFAVELALRAFKIGPEDEVLLSAYDYPGNFLSIHAVGATPVLVDVEPQSWQIDVAKVAASIGPACKAIIVSHLHGGVVPMARARELAERHGLRVIEDAAQCPGGHVESRKLGCLGDAGVFSFGGSKLLSAGRGGALLFQAAEDYQRAKAYQLRGNLVCPLSELQAAVLCPQLNMLDVRNMERKGRVHDVANQLADVPGIRLFDASIKDSMSGYYKVGFQFDAQAFGLDRALFVRAVRAEGIAMDEGFPAAHIGRSNRRYRAVDALPEAGRAHRGCVVLHHPILLAGPEGVRQVAEAIRKVHVARGDIAARAGC